VGGGKGGEDHRRYPHPIKVYPGSLAPGLPPVAKEGGSDIIRHGQEGRLTANGGWHGERGLGWLVSHIWAGGRSVCVVRLLCYGMESMSCIGCHMPPGKACTHGELGMWAGWLVFMLLLLDGVRSFVPRITNLRGCNKANVCTGITSVGTHRHEGITGWPVRCTVRVRRAGVRSPAPLPPRTRKLLSPETTGRTPRHRGFPRSLDTPEIGNPRGQHGSTAARRRRNPLGVTGLLLCIGMAVPTLGR
jgi:hypothetical protein